jgi:hypothetical protein
MEEEQIQPYRCAVLQLGLSTVSAGPSTNYRTTSSYIVAPVQLQNARLDTIEEVHANQFVLPYDTLKVGLGMHT